MKTQPVTKINEGDIAPYCLLPGSPERAEWMSTFLDEARNVGDHRGIKAFTGEKDGVPISIVSTGMGASGAAFVIEELIKLGAHTLIRVGTCGWIQPHIKTGDVNICTGAVRDDGLTAELISLSYPAISNIDVVNALIASAREVDHPYHVGLCRTGAAWYGIDVNQFEEIWKPANVNVFENEAAALLIIASLRGVRAGAIVAVDDAAGAVEALALQIDKADAFMKGVEAEIQIAINALVRLGKNE